MVFGGPCICFGIRRLALFFKLMYLYKFTEIACNMSLFSGSVGTKILQATVWPMSLPEQVHYFLDNN